jgi:hypothetical protein
MAAVPGRRGGAKRPQTEVLAAGPAEPRRGARRAGAQAIPHLPRAKGRPLRSLASRSRPSAARPRCARARAG